MILNDYKDLDWDKDEDLYGVINSSTHIFKVKFSIKYDVEKAKNGMYYFTRWIDDGLNYESEPVCEVFKTAQYFANKDYERYCQGFRSIQEINK